MRRIMVWLSVVALMVVMMALAVAPAFAAGWDATGCKAGDTLFYIGPGSMQGMVYGPIDKNGDFYVCVNNDPHGKSAYDNRL
jgi:hypothetical protein